MDKAETKRRGATRTTVFRALAATILLSLAVVTSFGVNIRAGSARTRVPINAAQIVQQCQALNVLPSPPKDFHLRTESDRHDASTPPTLIRNATIWTGGASGHEVVVGDVLIDKGTIRDVGNVGDGIAKQYDNLLVIDAGGAWVTPGIVDMHSHLGVGSAPALRGASDTNSHKGLVLPWLRSLDGLNTHDDAYQLSISGGVTTANVLPGSADAIGGQAFTIKLRPTAERSSSAMVIEPPHTLNGTIVDPSIPPRWRQMKHACGENPSRAYSGTRMDTIWAFRQGYETARKIKEEQDNYCAKALRGEWNGLGDFPDNLQWEALVDVLRGRVKVHNHCYEAVDLDGIVRLTNEFKFSIAAFHHAHETYLVPDLLKRTYGTTPAIAMFATNARYKREAYRGSEFAARILADNDLRVVMKSDHSVLNSRYLLYEAQQAHYYGLSANLALASVTTTPATVLGYDHRIGFIKPGHDADIVLWDSHPLALGATPTQVFIDGIAQLKDAFVSKKPSSFQSKPTTPDFTKDAQRTLEYDGLPPLETTAAKSDIVVFANVSSVFLRQGGGIREVFYASETLKAGVVVVEHGNVRCMGYLSACPLTGYGADIERINLMGGSIVPSLISYGSHLGLHHIDGEASTNDGVVHDPLNANAPSILGAGPVIRAVDGLQYSTRDALLAYRSGVTVGITAPTSRGFLAGLSTAFSTGSPHKLSPGAVLQDVTAVHVAIDSTTPSISTQIAALRHLLQGGGEGELKSVFANVAEGLLPLVVQVQSADIMATLIGLKNEIEANNGQSIKMTFAGANEAHLLAKEIGEAGVGVILNPSRPFPATWKSRRILPGPPLTQKNAVSVLAAHNVTVAIGVEEQWSARSTRFDVAWTALEANDTLSKADAIALASINLETLLGVKNSVTDLVAVSHGSLFDFDGRVAAVISSQRGVVDLIE